MIYGSADKNTVTQSWVLSSLGYGETAGTRAK